MLDKSGEIEHQFSLEESLSRSKKQKLFSGYIGFCSPNAEPEHQIIKRLFEFAGGTFKGTLSPANALEMTSNLDRPVICFATERDLMTMICIKDVLYHSELLLDGLLKQSLDIEPYRL